MKTIGERLDQKLAQDTREHCDMPEDKVCSWCNGTGKIRILVPVPHDVECGGCDGTGIMPDDFTDRVAELIADMKEAGK